MLTETHRIVFLSFAGLFGLLVGSFLNVCIFRLPRECMSIVRPRSRCTRCLRLIAWYDNFPVVSWLLLGGKCRNCKERISPRYALVELLTGALFAWSAYVQLYASTAPLDQRAVWFGVQAYLAAALVVCTFIDLDFRILPDEINFSGVVLGLAFGAAFPFLFRGRLVPVAENDFALLLTMAAVGAAASGGGWMIVRALRKPRPAGEDSSHWGTLIVGLGLACGAASAYLFHDGLLRVLENPHALGLATAILGGAVGAGALMLVRVLGEIAFKKEAMGMGDVKLMAFLGTFLGWRGVLLTFLVGCFAGALFGIAQMPFTRKLRGVAVPFGPFLAAGALVMIFFSPFVDRAISWYLDLMRQWTG